ncbi:MAG TPA: hypothetical protein DHV85_07745, partial [Candidatus Accumulibacter sp.]|nr:hypothetical protein [Accumulibacter sp.]
MATHEHSEIAGDRDPSRDRPSRRSWWVFGGFGVLSLILLAVEHRAHLTGWFSWFSWWPWLFLL